MKATMDENGTDTLMLTKDKKLRCIAILASKIMIASLGNPPSNLDKNAKCCHWENSHES